jgi:hypothetical protein
VPGLASNYSTLELLNVRNADRLSTRDALRIDRGDTGDAGRLPAIRIIQSLQRNESYASSNIEGRGRFEREPPTGLSLAAGIALLAGVTTAHAQSTGIVPCDDFLTKYDACIVSKVPEAQRAMYKTQIDQTRKAWVDMAKNPSTKATMEATCKQTLDATKASLTAYGCSF